MRGFYELEVTASMTGDDKEWKEDTSDDHKDTCCEDDYDDDEEEEKEWCD